MSYISWSTTNQDFFWQSDGHKKYRLARWGVICQPKEIGGLGVKDLDVQNQCLLSGGLNL